MYSYECIRSLSSHVGYNFEQACIKLKVQSVYYVRCLSYHMTQMGLFKWNYSGAFLCDQGHSLTETRNDYGLWEIN